MLVPPMNRLSLPRSLFDEQGAVGHFAEALIAPPQGLPARIAVGFSGEKAPQPGNVDPKVMLGPTFLWRAPLGGQDLQGFRCDLGGWHWLRRTGGGLEF